METIIRNILKTFLVLIAITLIGGLISNATKNNPTAPLDNNNPDTSSSTQSSQNNAPHDDSDINPNISPEQARHNLDVCIIRSVARDEGGIETMRNCAYAGILWCNKEGIKTSLMRISPVTGKIILDNQECIFRLEPRYIAMRSFYEKERENYIVSEDTGTPYRPIWFDIRTIFTSDIQPVHKGPQDIRNEQHTPNAQSDKGANYEQGGGINYTVHSTANSSAAATQSDSTVTNAISSMVKAAQNFEQQPNPTLPTSQTSTSTSGHGTARRYPYPASLQVVIAPVDWVSLQKALSFAYSLGGQKDTVQWSVPQTGNHGTVYQSGTGMDGDGCRQFRVTNLSRGGAPAGYVEVCRNGQYK